MQTPGRESSKSPGAAMTSDWGGVVRIFGGEIKTRDPHAVILGFLSREPHPAQRGGYCERSLTKAAAIVTHCVFLLPLGESSRRNKGDESIGQLSVYIG